jgi:hypothetical protein
MTMHLKMQGQNYKTGPIRVAIGGEGGGKVNGGDKGW